MNHIFAKLMELEGISTKDLYTKTYCMSYTSIVKSKTTEWNGLIKIDN